MSETRERELVGGVARAICEHAIRKHANKPTGYVERVNAEVDKSWREYEGHARTAIEALSASTQVDAMRDALEEAREAIIALLNGRPARYAELLAKIDAALSAD